MKFKKLMTLMVLVVYSIANCQENYTINGIITHKSNGETLFGASVFLKGTTIGVLTNAYGLCSITAKYLLIKSPNRVINFYWVPNTFVL